jgi:hypothetical protein
MGRLTYSLCEAQEGSGRDINPTFTRLREFSRKIKEGHHFLKTVLSEPKIWVAGSPDNLSKPHGEA